MICFMIINLIFLKHYHYNLGKTKALTPYITQQKKDLHSSYLSNNHFPIFSPKPTSLFYLLDPNSTPDVRDSVLFRCICHSSIFTHSCPQNENTHFASVHHLCTNPKSLTHFCLEFPTHQSYN